MDAVMDSRLKGGQAKRRQDAADQSADRSAHSKELTLVDKGNVIGGWRQAEPKS
jgi:hypothetical protein